MILLGSLYDNLINQIEQLIKYKKSNNGDLFSELGYIRGENHYKNFNIEGHILKTPLKKNSLIEGGLYSSSNGKVGVYLGDYQQPYGDCEVFSMWRVLNEEEFNLLRETKDLDVAIPLLMIDFYMEADNDTKELLKEIAEKDYFKIPFTETQKQNLEFYLNKIHYMIKPQTLKEVYIKLRNESKDFEATKQLGILYNSDKTETKSIYSNLDVISKQANYDIVVKLLRYLKEEFDGESIDISKLNSDAILNYFTNNFEDSLHTYVYALNRDSEDDLNASLDKEKLSETAFEFHYKEKLSQHLNTLLTYLML